MEYSLRSCFCRLIEFVNALKNIGLVVGGNVTRVSQGFSPVSVFETGNAVAAMVMTYNELALMLQAVNPATGKLYKLEELNLFDFNTIGTKSNSLAAVFVPLANNLW